MSEETTEMSEEAFEELWAQWDERLKAVGIHHGVPLGYGQEDIRVVARTRDSNITPFTDVNQREPENDDPDVINFWRLKRPWKGHHGYVAICRKEGKTCKAFVPHNSPATERIDMLIKTGSVRLNSALASAETKAREKLQSMLEPHQWKCYMLNDMFGERGHSGVLYFIRKGRPTLAVRMLNGKTYVLGTLCMHPLAYYEDTWAGALCPTDEMIAHLLSIRADEYTLWKKANHIPIDDPRSGI